MNVKKYFRNLGIISLLAAIIYFFLAAEPLGNELTFQTVWVRPYANVTVEQVETDSPIPFSVSNHFGYFTPEGKILLLKNKNNRVTITKDGYAEFSGIQLSNSVFDYKGNQTLTFINPTTNLPVAGYPLLTDYRYYVFMPDGDGVYCYDKKGNYIWKRESSSVITAFNSSKEGTIIGYSDGVLTYIDDSGNEVFSFTPGGSTYPIIFGADISQDGKYAACVTGIKEQRIVLIKIANGQNKIVYHEFLPEELKRNVFVKIDDKNDAIYYERKDGLGIIDLKKQNSNVLPIKGKIISLGSEKETSLTVALTKSEDSYTLSILEHPNYLLAQTNFIAENASLVQTDNSFYIITDSSISRIDISEK